MEKIDWTERVENYDYTTLKRMSTKWLGKGWRNCNCWSSMEALQLAELCKNKLMYFEKQMSGEISEYMTFEYYKEMYN